MPWGSLASKHFKWGNFNKVSSLKPWGHSFYVKYAAMHSGPLSHSTCQPCPWGPYWQCQGVICFKRLLIKKIKNILWNHEVSSSGKRFSFIEPLISVYRRYSDQPVVRMAEMAFYRWWESGYRDTERRKSRTTSWILGLCELPVSLVSVYRWYSDQSAVGMAEMAFYRWWEAGYRDTLVFPLGPFRMALRHALFL